MASVLAWLDFSEREKRRMMDVIDAFREKGTVDELGLGTIRDALADQLFPGTSTVMTRASYYLFIPWMYRELEQKGVPAAKLPARAKNYELELVRVIGKEAGNIGRRAGDKLKRLPSSIYWAGLGTWGIRQFPGSQQEYHRDADTRLRRNKEQHGRGEERDVEHDDVESSAWHGGVIKAPPTFPAEATLRLRAVDAHYLQQRLVTAPGTHHSLLAELARRRTPTESGHFIWQHPDADQWPAGMRELVHHAQLFSEIMWGASLLYNLMLSELCGDQFEDGMKLDYPALLQDWTALMQRQSRAFAAWDRARFWHLVQGGKQRVSTRTRDFCEAWWQLCASHEASVLPKLPAARLLITQRELALKKKLARLSDASARQRWKGVSGAAQLDYRWGITERLLQDIFDGLNEEGQGDAAR